jgi:ABC-2 type transport system ATP-binding protein
MRAFLRQINAADGVTILLTTHDLPDVERLCRRVVVIDRGRVIADDGLDALRRRSSGPRELVVDLAEPAPVLGTLPGVLTSSTEADGLRWRLRFEPPTSAAALVAQVMRHAEVRDVAMVEPSIEDMERTLYSATSDRDGSPG